ncbi:MAG: J domain-containing protein [Acidobacteria bacterium]|nr:MAG: J domain-containing protein [Acidobacteriota bacterium]
MPQKDYYSSLGVDRNASPEDIQRAYRKLARKYHPDVNRASGAEERFKEISEAYEVLKDPEKRKAYDRYGSAFQGAGGGGRGFDNVHFDFGDLGGGGFGSIFETFFGGRGRRRGGFEQFVDFGDAGHAHRAHDEEARLALTLEEAAAGGTRELTITDPMSGRSRTHKVKLPPGVKQGQRIRLAGRGSSGGDLYLTVEIRPHERFRLEGDDLYTTVAVTPWEAALGGEVKVPTLDGPVTVKVPAGASTGRKIRLKGKGFPKPKGGRGDLYAEVRIAVPQKLTPRERELFEELARVSRFRPR